MSRLERGSRVNGRDQALERLARQIGDAHARELITTRAALTVMGAVAFDRAGVDLGLTRKTRWANGQRISTALNATEQR